MPEPHRARLRKEVFNAWEGGDTRAGVPALMALFPRLGRATLYRWARSFAATGSWRRPSRPAGARPIVRASVLNAIKEILTSSPRLFHDEVQTILRERHGFRVSLSAINRAIHRKVEKGGLGYSRLVTARHARQRVDAERADFLSSIASFRAAGVQPEQFLVLDESHKKNSELLRRFGYGTTGAALTVTEFFRDGESFSLLGAFDIDGFVTEACMVTDENVDSEFYAGYIQGVVCPVLGDFAARAKWSIVIMDNVSSADLPPLTPLPCSSPLPVLCTRRLFPLFTPVARETLGVCRGGWCVTPLCAFRSTSTAAMKSSSPLRTLEPSSFSSHGTGVGPTLPRLPPVHRPCAPPPSPSISFALWDCLLTLVCVPVRTSRPSSPPSGG